MTPAEKSLIGNIQAHDLAESYRLRRAVHAQAQGLPPEAFALPFPTSQVVYQVSSMPSTFPGRMLVGLLGVVAVGGVVVVLGFALSSRTPPSAPAYRICAEVQDDSGRWLTIGQGTQVP